MFFRDDETAHLLRESTRLKEMSVPNRFGRLSLFGVQAAVLRMAIADLQAEADCLERSLREDTPSG